MPFKSDKQRAFLYANKPEVAKLFAEHGQDSIKDAFRLARKKRKKKFKG